MDPRFFSIDHIIEQLQHMLESDKPIPEDPFFVVTGNFSKEVKTLLATYFEADQSQKIVLQPYINYYRQLQNYLVFILRFPTILLVPHHSEIEQTLRFIRNKNTLITEMYVPYSQRESDLLHGDFHDRMEKLYDNRPSNRKAKNLGKEL